MAWILKSLEYSIAFTLYDELRTIYKSIIWKRYHLSKIAILPLNNAVQQYTLMAKTSSDHQRLMALSVFNLLFQPCLRRTQSIDFSCLNIFSLTLFFDINMSCRRRLFPFRIIINHCVQIYLLKALRRGHI